MTTTINELTNLARQLEEKSSKVDSIIATVNRKLAALKLELEVWLDDDPADAGDYEYYDEENEQSPRSREATLLGWSEFDEGWQLAVKDATLRTKTNWCGNEYEEVVNPRRPSPLVKQPRWLRMEAVRLLPALLTALQKKGKSAIEDIETAEGEVKAL